MLWRCELKKTLLNQKGIWVLLVCLVLKLVFLSAFPEQKDARILLSQKQYDKYLLQLHGEDTLEKSTWIISEYEHFKQVKGMQSQMQTQYAKGEITEAQWRCYTDELNQAELKLNSAAIFAEKAQQFSEQTEELSPAHYIYEYGWRTVYTLLRFPDVFLLFPLLLMVAQSFPAEGMSGMLPVLLSCRNGRRKLYRAKLLSMLTVCAAACAVFSGLEWAVLACRGWLNDAAAPLYSITIFAECPLELTLMQGYGLCLVIRFLVTAGFVVLVFGVSVWVQNTSNLLFTGLCLLALPMLWSGSAMLFTHSGLLRGTKMLLWLGESEISLWFPVFTVSAYSIIMAIFGRRRLEKGM